MLVNIIYLFVLFVFITIYYLREKLFSEKILTFRVVFFIFLIYLGSYYIIILFTQESYSILSFILFTIVYLVFTNILHKSFRNNFKLMKNRLYLCFSISSIIYLVLNIFLLYKNIAPIASINKNWWVAEYYEYLLYSNATMVSGTLMLIGFLAYIIGIIQDEGSIEGMSKILILSLPIFIIMSSWYDESIADFIKGTSLNQFLGSQFLCLFIYIGFEILFYYILAVMMITLAKPIRNLKNNI